MPPHHLFIIIEGRHWVVSCRLTLNSFRCRLFHPILWSIIIFLRFYPWSIAALKVFVSFPIALRLPFSSIKTSNSSYFPFCKVSLLVYPALKLLSFSVCSNYFVTFFFFGNLIFCHKPSWFTFIGLYPLNFWVGHRFRSSSTLEGSISFSLFLQLSDVHCPNLQYFSLDLRYFKVF